MPNSIETYGSNGQDAKAIANEKKFTELGTNKTGVYFTTKVLKGLATDYQEITESYTKTQSGLVKEIVNIAGTSIFRCCQTYHADISIISSYVHASFGSTGRSNCSFGCNRKVISILGTCTPC